MPASSRPAAIDTLTPQARLDEGRLHDVLGYRLAQAAIVTTDDFDRTVTEPMGMSKVELTLLHLINKNTGVTPSRLAKALAISMPAVTVWLGKLEQRGWVTRQRSATDRRSQHFEVTPTGQALVDRAVQALLEAERQTLASLSQAERAMLIELLDKVARRRKP